MYELRQFVTLTNELKYQPEGSKEYKFGPGTEVQIVDVDPHKKMYMVLFDLGGPSFPQMIITMSFAVLDMLTEPPPKPPKYTPRHRKRLILD